jgi:alpha-beta hydrolase superfamily lysophospholipase
VFPASFFYYFFKGLLSIQQPTFLRTLPKSLPVYIISGDKDPVGKFGKGVLELYERFRSLGFSDLSYKLYKDARHELLNETNREEVINDLLVWLHNHV